MTIYCDHPAHCEYPVEPFVAGPNPSERESIEAHLLLNAMPGVEIVSLMWNYPPSRRWAPMHRTAAGVTKRNGGLKGDRYRLKCDHVVGAAQSQDNKKCKVGPVVKGLNLGDALSMLAEQGFMAVSVKTLSGPDLIADAKRRN